MTHPIFDTLKSFGRCLTALEIQQLLEEFPSALEEMTPHIKFDEERYFRIPILSTEYFSTLLLTWRSGQRSPIHNHKGSACGVKVLTGTATEILFAQSPLGLLFPRSSNEVNAGEVVVSEDADTHQMANLHNSDLITFHLYSPPLNSMELFPLSVSSFGDYDRTLAPRPFFPSELAISQ